MRRADTNYSLYEKLRQSFDFDLPTLDDETSPENYWRSVTNAINTTVHSDWEVVRQITLGLFSFQKQVMWHDLEPHRWPRHAPLQDKPLIRRVLMGPSEDGPGPGARTEEVHIDDPSSPAAGLKLIRDADSSQHAALVDALDHGEGLVIEGPPGTGKSQTITNLIAAAMYQGKSVLFVAEKMAALEVVYRRLDEAGLGHFCMQLHGLKTGKRDLVASIGSRLNLPMRRRPSADRDREELDLARSRLLETSEAHRRHLGPETTPVYDLAWKLERLRSRLPIDVPPLQAEHFAGNPPARQVGEGDNWAERDRQMRPNRLELVPLEEPGSDVALLQHRNVRPEQKLPDLERQVIHSLQG